MKKRLPDKRIVRRFLFLPLIIEREWRWLEFAYIGQELVFKAPDKWIWINIKWML